MRFLVGTGDHQLRYIEAEKGCDAKDKSAPEPQVKTIFTSDATTTIQCLFYTIFPSSTRGDVDAVALACRDGTVQIIDAENGDRLASIPATTNTTQEHQAGNEAFAFVSIHICHGYIATCTASGLARFTKLSSLWSDSQTTYEIVLPAPISVLRMHPKESGVIAFAGMENELSIWKSDQDNGNDQEPFSDLRPLWTARNVKNDKLDLRVPVWVSDLQFLEGENQNGYRVVASTRYRQLRVYETSKARRPLISIDMANHPIAQMELDTKAGGMNSDVVVVFTDTQGNVMHANATTGQIIGSYKGFSGAVSSITVSTVPDCVAAGGMDSYLRVFDTSGHQELLNVYVGARITNVLVLPEDAEIKEEEVSGDESGDEDIWNELSEVNTQKSKGSDEDSAEEAEDDKKSDGQAEEEVSRHKRVRRA